MRGSCPATNHPFRTVVEYADSLSGSIATRAASPALMSPAPRPITELLRAVRNGDQTAAGALFDCVHSELKVMARRRLGTPARRSVTLDTGDLVSELYMKLFPAGTAMEWTDRRHFFSVAALAMRQIIVDHARRARAGKRGGGQRPVPFDSSVFEIEEQADSIVALNEALSLLERLDGRMSAIVQLKYFVGLDVAEIAAVMQLSERTVKRDLRKARAFLHAAIRGAPN